MVGEDYVRNELAQRLRHVVASLDTPERAEDVGPADLALSERRVLGVVLDDQDPNGGRHCRFHVYEMAEASARVSASIVHFGLRRRPVKRAPRPATLDERARNAVLPADRPHGTRHHAVSHRPEVDRARRASYGVARNHVRDAASPRWSRT